MDTRIKLDAQQKCVECYEIKELWQGEAVVRYGAFIEFTCDTCKNKNAVMYELSFTFRTDRKLTEDELGQLQTQCLVQIEEPTTHAGDDVTYSTSDICTDIQLMEAN